MTFTTREVVEAIQELLEGESGLTASLEALKAAYIRDEHQPDTAQLVLSKIPAEMQERAWGVKYPVLQVYCDRIESRPVERLRRFSGRVRVVVEIRVSGDRLNALSDRLHYYLDAVRDVVERNAGCVREGLYLCQEYEVQVEPVKKGGQNFLQAARIGCVVMVNRG
ncbi:MAG: hypothetical protein HY821_22630 [Acidobacteria bacterium]|nr:hypothetical protein [Acidobacteriota bacterium]